MSCRCQDCLPDIPELRIHASPRARQAMMTSGPERSCTSAHPCIEPYSAECACPEPETILQEAQRLVHGNRGADYGHPIEDYERTGRMWGAILGIPDIDPRICCLMMVAVKLSREVNKHKRDNLTDAAGYSECAQMVADKQGI